MKRQTLPVRLLLLLCSAALASASCTNSPTADQVCDEVSGSCLALFVNGRGSFAKLVVTANVLSDSALMPMAHGTEAASLPVTIALTPPLQLRPSEIKSLRVSALDADGKITAVGTTSVSWPDGTRSTATIEMVSTGSPAGPNTGPVSLSVSIPSGDSACATADFDGDGRQDFAALSSDGQSVVPFRNNGQGGFTRGSPVPLASFSTTLTAADVNRDGRADLLVGAADTKIYVALASSGGGFGTPAALTASGSSSYIAVGDFIDDDSVDLAVGDSTGTLTPWRGDGRGGFVSQSTAALKVSQSGEIRAVAATAPISGTRQGVAASGRLDPKLGIYAAVPGPALSVQSMPTLAFNATQLLAVDFDGDGRQDLLAMGPSMDLQILRHTGGTTFTSAWSFPLGLSKPRAVVLDFDRDGQLDVAAGQGLGTLILVRDGSSRLVQLGSTLPYGLVAAIDMNQDSKPELILRDNDLRLIVYYK